ncbi:MAG: hypothetical protein OEY44_00695 [Candidatus Peregrinibacteria bacterium]|nr:hypothetical protein [Candidatus Peregrinibacteria bacterium]
MCFSPFASFVAAGGLGVAGTASLSKVREKKELALASIPLLFGLQQLTEGMIWVFYGTPVWTAILTNIYAVFSHLLWPFFIPLSVFLVEPQRRRKRAIFIIFLLGVLVSIYILYFIIKSPISAEIVGKSIQYNYNGDYPVYTLAAYLMAVTLAPLFSSHRWIKAFGILLFLSAYISYHFYELTFFSVWCYFAAILSLIIVGHFHWGGRKKPPPKTERGLI